MPKPAGAAQPENFPRLANGGDRGPTTGADKDRQSPGLRQAGVVSDPLLGTAPPVNRPLSDNGSRGLGCRPRPRNSRQRMTKRSLFYTSSAILSSSAFLRPIRRLFRRKRRLRTTHRDGADSRNFPSLGPTSRASRNALPPLRISAQIRRTRSADGTICCSTAVYRFAVKPLHCMGRSDDLHSRRVIPTGDPI